jgi:selenide, water dikinase
MDSLTLSGRKPQGDGYRLTQYSHSAGCGCKVAPAILSEMLAGLRGQSVEDRLLVGIETSDDAAVYDMGDGMALISSVDFFMPIVDDAHTFGRIAAANAISDIYAMGGTPFLATAVLGWPVDKLPPALAGEVMAGARRVCEQAGVVLAGGHTIDSPEPFFGLSVNGKIATAHIKRNAAAQAGNVIYLTKPIGTGALSTAHKRGLIDEQGMSDCIQSMTTLNQVGQTLGTLPYIHALTDVTGFGLLGHLIEMCTGSQLSALIDYASVPLLPRVKELCAQYIYADNTMRNWKAYEAKTEGANGESLLTLCDPQTNGGLLIAVDAGAVELFEAKMKIENQAIYRIGALVAARDKGVYIAS